jgi:hypothetical protein
VTFQHVEKDKDILSVSPRLSELRVMSTPKQKKVKIIESIAADWKKIGAQLDFDAAGYRLKIIAESERDKPEQCCQSMFQYWLEGHGVPTTWRKLIRILQDCEFNVLAADVKEALKICTGMH